MRLALGAVGVAATALGMTACLNRPLCDTCHPITTNIFVQSVPQRAVNKIDLLFAIDNSSSMADKQQVLSEAVPDLVKRLVNPDCVNPTTGARTRPAQASDGCGEGSAREFQPVTDIHVGVVTSSIGGHGANVCPGLGETDEQKEQGDDRGHLIATRPRFGKLAASTAGLQPPTNLGFLDWNPTKTPGADVGAFEATFTLMTKAAGQAGCGYESQLESLYRFLIDPTPYDSIRTGPCSMGSKATCAFKQGTDQEVLNERAAFLRPDSLVAVIMLTDENDCSVQEGRQGFLAVQGGAIAGAAAVCGSNPNDPCCYSCGAVSPPAGCAPDPTCTLADGSRRVADPDSNNLRCFQQKKRFGNDYLYPTNRYVNALTKEQICTSNDDLSVDGCVDAAGDGKVDLYDNPLFLAAAGALRRSATQVYFAGIVGVPWQDLQATKDPDGKDYPDPTKELHYKPAKAMKTDGTWDMILGTSSASPPIAPKNSLMLESTLPRSGVDGQGKPLGAQDGPPNANPVNGHEWGVSPTNPKVFNKDDLQYACIFPLPVDPQTGQKTRACPPKDTSCDCNGDDPLGKPLCQNPDTGSYGDGATQYFAKAYPGLRELQVLKDFGDNSIVASICARKLDDQNAQDYGYRPAVDAIIDRLKEALSDKCLPRELNRDETGNIPCSVVEVTPRGDGAACDPSRGRLIPDEAVKKPVLERLKSSGGCDSPGAPACASLLLCNLQEAKKTCHTSQRQVESGWCYVDPEKQPADDPNLVAKCQVNQKRIIRFVDDGKGQTPAVGATVMIACFGADISDDKPLVSAATPSAAPAMSAAP